jgi:hypothetical protein
VTAAGQGLEQPGLLGSVLALVTTRPQLDTVELDEALGIHPTTPARP